jgi:hypothetical protein
MYFHKNTFLYPFVSWPASNVSTLLLKTLTTHDAFWANWNKIRVENGIEPLRDSAKVDAKMLVGTLVVWPEGRSTPHQYRSKASIPDVDRNTTFLLQ